MNNTKNVTCLERLKIELTKQYFPDETFCMYLEENNLQPTEIFDKSTMYKGLLQTTYDILEALSNNIDLFRSVETEFGTYSEAYKSLSQRLDRLDKKINQMPNNDNTEKQHKSAFTHMYFTKRRV